MEEDPGSLNYLTTYQYDVLDNLTQVNQGSQQRGDTDAGEMGRSVA